MTDQRLSEAQATARCDELGLQHGSKMRECFELLLVTYGERYPKGAVRKLAEALGRPVDGVWKAIERARNIASRHTERKAAVKIPRGPRIDVENRDVFDELKINRYYLRRGRAIRICMTPTASKPRNPLACGDEWERDPKTGKMRLRTAHIGKGINGTALSDVDYAQAVAEVERNPTPVLQPGIHVYHDPWEREAKRRPVEAEEAAFTDEGTSPIISIAGDGGSPASSMQ